MTDIVNESTRSRMMSGIRSKNTLPEIIIRSALHKDGFRFRIHANRLPGTPDIVLKKHNAVIFIHGCFWHRHDCRYFKWPKSKAIFWEEKLNKNKKNDEKNLQIILKSGWRVCIVWECAIRDAKQNIIVITDKIEKWLMSNEVYMEVDS